jgi:hypothetical protein
LKKGLGKAIEIYDAKTGVGELPTDIDPGIGEQDNSEPTKIDGSAPQVG